MEAEPTAVVLAAGKGTRMKSDLPKVLHECFGEAMITHVCRSLRRSRIPRQIAVLGTGKQQVENVLRESVETVEQKQQKGTGHAVQQAVEELNMADEVPLIVTCGDIPGIRPETYESVVKQMLEGEADAVVLTSRLDDPSGYGRVVCSDQGLVEQIVEDADASSDQKQIKLVNTGIICATAGTFRKQLPQLSNDNESGEYYLTDVIGLIRNDGGRVESVEVQDNWEITGINTRRQLVEFEQEGYRRQNQHFLDNGVTVRDPQRVKIGPWVEIGEDVELEGDVTIIGESTVGRGSRICGRVQVTDSVIGEENDIRDSTLSSARLGNGVRVGPYCHVRPGTEVGDGVRLGNFVEIKKSTVQSHTNIAHLSYIGDAEVGADVNVGAGTITCNYDGYEKHKTTIEDHVFIGSNSELVAPVTVGEGAMIGAGSTVTEDVPKDSLYLSRAGETIRKQWVEEVWRPRKESD